jgi:hypothetical protein
MTLDAVVSGKLQRPIRVLIHGTEGVGKSTFASDAPAPIFLCPEDGTARLDVVRFPEPQTLSDVYEAIDILMEEEHAYRTLVIDTVDWLEPMVWKHVCEKAKKKDIEAFGFGKGYTAALDEWRKLISMLDRLRMQREMHIILVAHSQVKPYNNPEGENFDRYELKLHNKSGGLLKEWTDAVLFATYEQATYESGLKHKGVASGARIMRTERRAAFDAKNRFGLPFEMPLSFADFWQLAQGETEHQAPSLDEIHELAELANEDVTELLEKADGNPVKLSKLTNWLKAKIQTEGTKS